MDVEFDGHFSFALAEVSIWGCPSGFCASAALNDLNPIKRDVNPFRKIATQKPDGHPQSGDSLMSRRFRCYIARRVKSSIFINSSMRKRRFALNFLRGGYRRPEILSPNLIGG